MDHRLAQLQAWLSDTLEYPIQSIEPASADASFRRYFRVEIGAETRVVMDAPPEREATEPFINTAHALSELGVHTPKIYDQDTTNGFLVLEDLGSRTYLAELSLEPHKLYSSAIDALIKFQAGHSSSTFKPPSYSADKLESEMSLFSEWFIDRHLGGTMSEDSTHVWQQTQQTLIEACLKQPQVWVHRDFHSRNLMITQKNSPGVIDFQDLVVGPLAYDLASIFKDCYIEWPRAQQHEWLEEYRLKVLKKLDIQAFSLEQLIRWVDLTGLQRHLKVLGIFCRLNYRDQKDHYLNDLPLVAKYTLEVIELHPELKDFKHHFAGQIARAL